MTCDICKSSDTYVKMHKHSYIIKGKEISFDADRRFCKNCNNLVYDDKLDNEASLKAISIYNKEVGIDKEKIIELRKRYDLSQELFSKVIGCAKKTLISYEKGKSIPNDSYLIVLKSLMAKPDAIVTIINANKEQFTDKEFEKISGKIKNIKAEENIVLSEYNGYTKLSINKLYNMILFFASKTVLKTKLLKEMFYSDFMYYKLYGKSITGLEYVHLPFGPVPNHFEYILNNAVNEKLIDYAYKYNNDYECHNISSKKKFDSSIFNDEELKILNEIKNKFLKYGSKDIVEFSHKEKAFTDTKLQEKISYDYAFDIEI